MTRRWIVRIYYPPKEPGGKTSMGLDVDRDKGAMRRALRRLRAGTPRAWGWRYALEIEPMVKRSTSKP